MQRHWMSCSGRNSRRYGSQRKRKENSDMMDERTTQVRNKIMSEMAMLMYLFVAAAFAVKVLLMGKGIRDCVVEYVILILAPLYQYVRARQSEVQPVPAGIRQPATSCQAQSCLRGSGRTGIHPGFLENLEKQEPWMPKRRSRGC